MGERYIIWRRKKPTPDGLFWVMFGKFDKTHPNESGEIEILTSITEDTWTCNIHSPIKIFDVREVADIFYVNMLKKDAKHILSLYGDGGFYDSGVDVFTGDRYE